MAVPLIPLVSLTLTVSYLTIIALTEHASNMGKKTKIDTYTGEIEHARGKKTNIVKAQG